MKKISDLEIPIRDKQILSFLVQPRSIAQVAAKLDLSYSTIAQKLAVLKEKNWVHRNKSHSGKTFFKLNEIEIKP